jgi:hypothetical protein
MQLFVGSSARAHAIAAGALAPLPGSFTRSDRARPRKCRDHAGVGQIRRPGEQAVLPSPTSLKKGPIVVSFDEGGPAMDDTRKRPQGGPNEGEGSKSADEQYRKGATEFAKRTDTLQKGMEAEREVENYRDEYERAEESGKARSAGDLKSDLQGENDRRR